MADNRKRASRGGKQAASARVRFAVMTALPLPRVSASATQAARPQRERGRDNVQAPKGEFIEAVVLPPRRYAPVFPSSARSSPRAGSAMLPCRVWSMTSTLRVSALSTCRVHSSMRCRAMALTRASH